MKDLLSRFHVAQVMQLDPQTKTMVILGTIQGETAIVTLEKSAFAVKPDKFALQSIIDDILLIQENDVYFWSAATLKQRLPDAPGAKLNLIYPATTTHIRKYIPQAYHYVRETPEMYEKYVVPYIQTMKGDRIKWVYNILFEGKESETFIHHDKDPETGFVLLPDMKWDRVSFDSLYLCTIVNRTDISSVRDLNSSHVGYLEEISRKIKQATTEKYAVKKDELRLFVHYQPSYYHFHIHVVSIKHSGLGDGINVGKAILLDDIIDNIKLAGDYYQRKTLGYVLGENHGLWNDEGYREAHLKNL